MAATLIRDRLSGHTALEFENTATNRLVRVGLGEGARPIKIWMTMKMNSVLANTVSVSFVHGFHDTVTPTDEKPAPALREITGDREETYRYVFPVNPGDFGDLPYPIVGEYPLTGREVERRPRYGFTGLERVGDHLHAAS